jgi:hypothetical protein
MTQLFASPATRLDEFRAIHRAAQTRLLDYAATLPPALRGYLPASWCGLDQVFDPHPYASLTAEFFGVTEAATIAECEVAGALMEAHCCFQDARIDEHERLPRPVSESLSNLFLAESITRFQRVAGDAAALAPHVQRAFADLAHGYVTEDAQEEDAFQTVTNRCAPFHILVAALGLHGGQPEKIEACSRMSRHLLFWFQILDDGEDWPEDLACGRQTHFLKQLEPLLPGREFSTWTRRDVEDALYLFGGAEAMLTEASAQLEAALAIAEPHGSATLSRWIRALLSEQRELRQWCLARKRAFLESA